MDLAGLEQGRGGGIGGRGAGAAQVPLWTPLLALPRQLQEPSRERTPPKLDGHCAEQPGVMTKVSFPWVPCYGVSLSPPMRGNWRQSSLHASPLFTPSSLGWRVWRGKPPFCPAGFCHWSVCFPGLAHTPDAVGVGVQAGGQCYCPSSFQSGRCDFHGY